MSESHAAEAAYELEAEWGRASGARPTSDVCDVGVDRHDNVYVFARDAVPVRVFTRSGEFIRSWGEGQFVRPHGLAMGRDDSVFLTDEGSNTVWKFSLTGEVLLKIAAPRGGAPFMSGEPFNRCTHTTVTTQGDIYVSDGYGNARIHRFSPSGDWIASWGESGCEPGQFNVPHNICSDERDRIYVADRENHRIQVFDADGRYLTQWNNLHRPCALTLGGNGGDRWYLAEMGPALKVNRNYPNLGCVVKILDGRGMLVTRIGGARPGAGPLQFVAPHGIAVDSHGDIYVAEVSRQQWSTLFPDTPVPPELRTLRKLRLKLRTEKT